MVDVREELEVLHNQQLVNARGMLYPDADEFPEQNLAALTLENSIDVKQEVIVEPPIGRDPSEEKRVFPSVSLLRVGVPRFPSAQVPMDSMAAAFLTTIPLVGTIPLGMLEDGSLGRTGPH